MASALFKLSSNGGSSYLSAGVAMADANALAYNASSTYSMKAALDSTAGVEAIAWTITSADDAHIASLPTVTTNSDKTCTFSVPKTGGTWLLRCLVNNGVNKASGEVDSTLDRSLAIKVLNSAGQQEIAIGETVEAGAYGYTKAFNDIGRTAGSGSATSLRGNPLATAVGTVADAGTLLVHDGASWNVSDPPAVADTVPQWTGTSLTYVPYAVNTGVLEVDLTGRGASPSLTAEECSAGVVVLTGTLAADTVCSLPADAGRTWLFRRNTSGTYTLAIAGADTGVAHMLPGQCRRLSVDTTDKLLGEALWVLEMDVIVSLTSPALAAGDNLLTICKLPSRCAVSQADVQGLVTLSGGDGTYTMSLGTAAGGAGPGYDQLIADGDVPDANELRGASVGDAGSAMTAGDAYDSAARTVTLRVDTGSQTVAPNQGSVRVHLVARWYGV